MICLFFIKIAGKNFILLFNPNDNHSCTQNDRGTLYYKGLNIPKNKMLNLTEEITGKRQLNGFSENVIYSIELKYYILSLHKMIMK